MKHAWSFKITPFGSDLLHHGHLVTEVSMWESHVACQIASREQVCNSSLPPLTTVENLYIYKHRYLRPHWQDDIENELWLELSYPFIAVKSLYLSKQFAQHIIPALQELVEGRMGFEPLGPVQEGIGLFVAAWQLSSHPIVVSLWDRDLEQGGS
ncbi:hypothetical protein F5888DRAFT_1635563 [Russula emetica]|nr:hypothetical protein F5888DRAFT_1635563 [Russula emetica]